MPAPTLPPELFSMIIDHLDVRTLVRCREVCKILRNLIDHSPSFQYKIELAVAGMVDGPPSDLGPIERLHILNAHQTAWDQLWWKESHVPAVPSRSSWVCSGSVLAMGYHRLPDFFVTLTQLPSVLRGIERKTWSIVIKGIHSTCGCEIDPSQDLIVLVVNQVQGEDSYRHVHLHLLSTGEPHPLSSGVLIHREHPRPSFPVVYFTQIVDDMVGVQCWGNYLTIWNWKTGELRMNMWDECFFSFLTKDLVMTGVAARLAIHIYDLRRSSNEEGTPVKIPLLCTFEFPQHAASTSILGGIFTDLFSGKTSRYTHSAPFCVSQNDRLYAFKCSTTCYNPFWLMVFAPLSTFMARIDSLRAGETRSFSWEEWGEKDARVLEFHHQFNSRPAFRCIHGTKFSIVNNNQIEVYDFNRLSFKRGFQSGTAHRPPLSIITNNVFSRPVYSSLLYQVRSAPMPDSCPPCLSVSITEDCLIPLLDRADFPPLIPIFSF